MRAGVATGPSPRGAGRPRRDVRPIEWLGDGLRARQAGGEGRRQHGEPQLRRHGELEAELVHQQRVGLEAGRGSQRKQPQPGHR